MDRTACVDIAALPLQVLLRRRPEWRGAPVAVLDRDRPHGRVLWVNERARASRVLPGTRYAAALSLCGALRAGEVSAGEVEEAVDGVVRLLQGFSPRVEAARGEAGVSSGVFWLDASGLELLHQSLLAWARLVRSELERRLGLAGTVVVGFTRFGAGAIARSSRGVTVLARPEDEEALARRVPLERLALEPAARETLERLGVRTAGEFADLPPDGLERRLGAAARRLHRLARGELRAPVESLPAAPPLLERVHLDHGEGDLARLLGLVDGMLERLLGALAGRDHALAELELALRFENGERLRERLRPAAPTLERAQLVELVSLRLASRPFPDLVTDIELAAGGRRVLREQLDLFAARPARDLAAANRALARVRAELGEGAVARAATREGHLPEARFSWELLERIGEPVSVDGGGGEGGVLVRRLWERPIPLPARPRHEPDGWMLRGLEQGPVARVLGPYVISGGWWRRAVHREYHFAETRSGDILWVYYDRPRRRWFIQGRVE